MPRTGTIAPIGKTGNYRARIRLGDGSRPWVKLPEGISKVLAHEKAAYLQEREDRDGLLLAAKLEKQRKKGGGPGETVRQYAARWILWRRELGLACVGDNEAQREPSAFPILGDEPIATVARDTVETIVVSLDEKVRAEQIAWKTALNIWGTITKLFTDACGAKPRELRVRQDNPTTNIAPPDKGIEKGLQYLYPSEFLTLISCSDVPLPFRRLVAFAVYTYTRAGETAALREHDVSLEGGTVHIHRSLDRVRNVGVEKPTKNKKTRKPPIEKNLVPLLEALCNEAEDGARLVTLPSASQLPKLLRRYLVTAGVKREELFITDETRRAIRWHDLRGTAATWMALRGDDPLKIMSRCGHQDVATTMRYVREAENLSIPAGDVFPPLPEHLYRSDVGPRTGPRMSQVPGTIVGATGFEDSTESENDENPREKRESSTLENPSNGEGNRAESGERGPRDSLVDHTVDAVEIALAEALTRATTEGRWELVGELARQLDARRLARAGNVVSIATRRAK